MATRKHTTQNYKDGSVVTPSLPQPIRLTSQKLEEKRVKGLCYSCDRKYTKGHNCAENKLFYMDLKRKKKRRKKGQKKRIYSKNKA